MCRPLEIPVIGEEPCASLLRILQLHEGEGGFTGGSLPQLRSQVFGGQVVAQAMLAAGASVEDGLVPDSIHVFFLEAARVEESLRFVVDRVRDGRTFMSRSVSVRQAGTEVAHVRVSFTRPHSAQREFVAPMPNVPDPEDIRDSIEIFQQTGHPVARFLGRTVAFRVRHVDGPLYVRAPKEPVNRQAVWVQPRSHIPAGPSVLPSALLAYVSDQFMLEPALRSLGISWAHPGLRVATLDHAVWFHAPVSINDWLLFVQDAPASAGGRSLVRASVYSRSGELVASAAQEGLVAVSDETSSSWRIDGGSGAAIRRTTGEDS